MRTAKVDEVPVGLNGATEHRVCHGPLIPIGGAEQDGGGATGIVISGGDLARLIQ